MPRNVEQLLGDADYRNSSFVLERQLNMLEQEGYRLRSELSRSANEQLCQRITYLENLLKVHETDKAITAIKYRNIRSQYDDLVRKCDSLENRLRAAETCLASAMPLLTKRGRNDETDIYDYSSNQASTDTSVTTLNSSSATQQNGAVQTDNLPRNKDQASASLIDDRPFKCDLCDKTYKYSDGLVRHRCSEHRPPAQDPSICYICNRHYPNADKLELHMAQHKYDHSYQCKICNAFFSRRAHMQNHMYVHSGERPYKCKLCGKAYRCPSSLRSHRRGRHDLSGSLGQNNNNKLS